MSIFGIEADGPGRHSTAGGVASGQGGGLGDAGRKRQGVIPLPAYEAAANPYSSSLRLPDVGSPYVETPVGVDDVLNDPLGRGVPRQGRGRLSPAEKRALE